MSRYTDFRSGLILLRKFRRVVCATCCKNHKHNNNTNRVVTASKTMFISLFLDVALKIWFCMLQETASMEAVQSLVTPETPCIVAFGG